MRFGVDSPAPASSRGDLLREWPKVRLLVIQQMMTVEEAKVWLIESGRAICQPYREDED